MVQTDTASCDTPEEDYRIRDITKENDSNYCVGTGTASCDTPEEDYRIRDITKENDSNYCVGTDRYCIM